MPSSAGFWRVIVDTRKGREVFVPMNTATAEARPARKTRALAEADVSRLNATARPDGFTVKPVLDRPDLGEAYQLWEGYVPGAVVLVVRGTVECRDCSSRKCRHVAAVKNHIAARVK